MRYRLTFSKTPAMRYTSHLDLHRTWERMIRRAGLPLSYSQGFNPHPKINLASALPLGFTGENEVIDIWLDEEITPDEVCERLRKAAPPGVDLHQVQGIDERLPSLQTVLEASEYILTALEPMPDLASQVQVILNADELPRERRGKKYDLRPLILGLEILPADEEGRQRLFVRLAAKEGATGRPEEVILALGGEPEKVRAHRTGLVFA